MFPLSPLSPDDFFRDGRPCQDVAECPYPSSPNLFHKACQGGLNMVAAPFGKRYSKTFIRNGHSFAPFLRSSCEEVWRRHGADIMAHLCPTKRRADSYNQYLYVYYQHLAGLGVNRAPRRRYMKADKPIDYIVQAIRDPKAGIVCLNDNETIKNWEARAATVRWEIEHKLEATTKESDSYNKMFQKSAPRPIDVLIVHYNTPELTAAAIRSLRQHTPGVRVTIFDNSDKRPFAPEWIRQAGGNVEIVDNTRGQVVDWEKWLDSFPDKVPTPENRWGSAKHCYSVELMMDRFPDGFLLMDSDVLVKQDVSDLADPNVPWKGGVHCNTRRFGVGISRVIPFLCWINTPLLKRHGIRYFNGAKMWNIVSRKPDRHYDTGAWLLEACNVAGLDGATVDIKQYVEHYGHASWHKRKEPSAWLAEHRNLWRKAPVTDVRYTVLTYIFGGYDKVHEVREKDPSADYILVTDDPSLRSETWSVVLYNPEGRTVLEKMYDVRFDPFRFCETELCVRLDAAIGINCPLRPFVDEMEAGGYDRCLMIHPRRNSMPSEYEAWVRGRGYSRQQADRCLAYMAEQGYDMGYRGLFQSCFEVVRRNAANAEANARVLDILRLLAPDGHVERINQTILSFVLNRYFSGRIKVLPVAQSVVTDGRFMTWYKHGSDQPNRSPERIAPHLFGRPASLFAPACP